MIRTALIALLLLQGCASTASHRYMVAGVALDTASTVYGLTATDLSEEGPVSSAFGQDDALAAVVITSALTLWLRHWLGNKYPDWQGWPTLDYAFGTVRWAAGVSNVHLVAKSD